MSFLTRTQNLLKRHITTKCMALRNATPNRIEIPKNMEVILTDVESQICTLFDECTKHLKEEKEIITSCRIAGGWVRDKLLGSQSNDIDIALTDIMGVPFAEHLVSFAKTKGVSTSEVAKIESNPDQSKHLETATFRILDRDLDLVNLRSEEYTGNSRIPNQVTFGTPLQDALRRDITINALFYNIHTRTVEDLTERGLEDLRNGVIRTPLPPKETFQDDPLRVIRCVRFASRFGFDMVPELEDATRDPVIQEALMSKVSRERVGEELDKMMKGRDPLRAIQLINDLSLYSPIFSVLPPEISASFSAPPAPGVKSLATATILNALLYPIPSSSAQIPSLHPTLLSTVFSDPTSKARLFLSAALTPYSGITYIDNKKKTHTAVEAVIREGLKLGTQNHYLDGIPPLFAAARLLKDPALDSERFKVPSERVAIGLLLREKVVHNSNNGSHWTTSLLFSLVQELVPLYDPMGDVLDDKEASRLIGLYNAFVRRVEELNLPASVDAKPVLDGHEVVRVLGASRPGPWTGQVLTKVMEWQLQYPEKTKEECSAWLKSEQDAGRIHVDAGSSEPASKKARLKR